MNRAMCILLSFSLMVSGTMGCSVSRYSTKFHDASVNDRIKTGMTKEEIRQVLGTPTDVETRKNAVDLREVWTYTDHDYGRKKYPSDAAAYIGWGALTLLSAGIMAIILPPPPSTHYIIFSDEKVIGWDLRDPFAPDLIIEKRER